MRQLSQQEAISVLNTLLSSFELIELLDKIKGTTLYKQSLKAKINMLTKELEPLANQLQSIWGIDDEAMYSLMAFKTKLLSQITLMRPEEQATVSMVFNMLTENPAEVMEKLGIAIKESEKAGN